MDISGVLPTAVSGIHAASQQFRAAANNIVNANTPNYAAQEIRTFSQVANGSQGGGGVTTTIIEGGDVDLAAEFINMTQAKISYTANAKVIATSEELVGSLLDITG